MKLKEIKENIFINKVVLKMPDEIFDIFHKQTSLPTKDVIVTSLFNAPSGYWVKTEATGDKIFPIPNRDPKETLEWEVLKILK